MPGQYSKQSTVLEVVTYGPGSSSNVKNDIAALQKAEGFKGVVFEGDVKEEEGTVLRVVEWASSDVVPASTGSQPTSEVFQMYDSTPMDSSKAIEMLFFHLKSDVSFAEFYNEWSSALDLVTAFPGCAYAAIGQGVKDDKSIVHIQPWATLEAHTVGFQQSPTVGEVMDVLNPIMKKYFEGGLKGIHVLVGGKE